MDPRDDPEARIRELERSLSDAAGKSELTAAGRGGGYDKYSASPTTRTTAGFRGSKTALLVVAIGLPASAAFSLYPNAAALADAFQNGIAEDTVTPCPDGKESPATYQNDAAPMSPLDPCSVEATTRGRT